MSRLLSGVIAAVGMMAMIVKHGSEGALDYFLFLLAVLPLIWFPDAINDYAMGSWVDGYTIDNPTPPLMISLFGWIALLALNGYVFGWL